MTHWKLKLCESWCILCLYSRVSHCTTSAQNVVWSEKNIIYEHFKNFVKLIITRIMIFFSNSECALYLIKNLCERNVFFQSDPNSLLSIRLKFGTVANFWTSWITAQKLIFHNFIAIRNITYLIYFKIDSTKVQLY